MAEENQQQVQQEPQQVTTKEPQQVTTKNLKKVEAGKRLGAHSCRIREAKKMKSEAASGANQCYGIGAVTAVGVIGGLSYYIYRTKKGEASREVKDVSIPRNPTQQTSLPGGPCPKPYNFEMD